MKPIKRPIEAFSKRNQLIKTSLGISWQQNEAALIMDAHSCKEFSAILKPATQIVLLSRKMVQAKLSYQCLRLSLNQYVNIITVPPRHYVKIMADLHALVASMWVHLGVRY